MVSDGMEKQMSDQEFPRVSNSLENSWKLPQEERKSVPTRGASQRHFHRPLDVTAQRLSSFAYPLGKVGSIQGGWGPIALGWLVLHRLSCRATRTQASRQTETT